ncbi:MAG: glycosyltransferase family 2 protein [Taibaiella sp.]|nr:glycosyltransferase family 2 protein [Taibaiella sp.]
MDNTPLLSIVSPVYKAEKIVHELVKRITEEVTKITDDFEIILVEDGSPDDSWGRIEEVCTKDKRVKGIKLSRNFGQHFAITAGIENALGNYVVVMDCDLQDDPVYIPVLYKKSCEGFDIVYTYKNDRVHGFWKNITANFFNTIFNSLIDNKDWKSHSNVGSFSLLTRKAVDAFCSYNDYQRHYLMVLRWIGFNNTYVEIEHKKRYEGKSSYNFSKLLLHALNGVTSQSDKLLRINVTIGIFLSILSFISIIIIIFLYFVVGFMSGWASLIVVLLFSTGILLTSVGISGIYIGKTFEQTKNRPKFLIDKRLN